MDPFEAYLISTDEKQLIGDILAQNILASSLTGDDHAREIFDLGCGSGEISLKILNILDSHNIEYGYDAIDPSVERVDKFREKISSENKQKIHFLEEAFGEEYTPIRPYDILIACQSLYYFEDLQKIIQKILAMSKEVIIVHHGATGLEAFENIYSEFFKKSVYGISTYIDVRKVLDLINYNQQYQIEFKNIFCSVDIKSCKDPESTRGQALLSFFLGNSIKSFPLNIQKEMSLFMQENYPDTIQREQGIFFIKHTVK